MSIIADRVLTDGKIITVDSKFSFAGAMAVKDGKIIYVGDNAGVAEYIGEGTVVTDLEGKTVLPGFIESHVHMNEYGNLLGRYDPYGKSREQILKELKELASGMEEDDWLVGAPRARGYDWRKWDNPEPPTLEELDEAMGNIPTALNPAFANGGIWINTAMIRALGFEPGSEVVESCRLKRSDGSKSGAFVGEVDHKIWDKTSKPRNEKQKRKALLAAEQSLFSFGFTAVVDASNLGEWQEDVEKLYADGLMKIRYFGCLKSMFYHPETKIPAKGGFMETYDKRTEDYFNRMPIIGAYGGRYNVRTVKFGTGGTIDNRGANELEDYSDMPGWKGRFHVSYKDLLTGMTMAYDKGLQLMTHAIGDADIKLTLDCLEAINNKTPIRDRRCKIEHYQLISGDSNKRMKEMGVIPSMQAMHGPDSADIAIKRLGPDRVRRAYATGLALREIGMVLGGSDAPAATPRAMSGIHAQVTCKNDHLEPEGGFYPENAISVEDAIRSYTIWGAYAQYAENERGSLETGKLADYVILDGDPTACEADDILKINVVETVLEGETVYLSK